MNTLILTLGGKGGVGKTLALVTLADYLAAQGREFVALDCDTENAGKASAFSHAVPEAGKPNLRSIADCDRLLTTAAEAKGGITLADLPANASGDFMGWFDDVSSPETLDALQVRIIGIGCITPESATFSSVAEWAARLQHRISYVVALNHRVQHRVEQANDILFPEYFTTETGKRFRKTFVPGEVVIPTLYDGSMTSLIRSGKLPSEAANASGIPILDRTRIKTWVTKVHQNWADVFTKLNL